MLTFLEEFRHRLSSEKGATMVEYGLMVGLIAVIVALAVGPLGIAVSNFFVTVPASL